ncbi:MAG: fibrobacter succinogenes major paralogous domain-containing protein [Fibromonadaceae bacterium]|jgi:uncharacterized protein (TIGR02145 family)|nr:fibrobacter succinogenes major paralogous domain-containing protein [Fibromonadaceae bacterium]
MYGIIICLVILIHATAFATCNSGIFTDSRDNKMYKWVKIGSQTWMAENLAFGVSSCDANCEKYGGKYEWESAMEVCPKGWHLPSDAEWTALVAFAGGEDVAGKKLKSKSGWDDVCFWEPGDDEPTCNPKGSNGTDEYGFSALPGGACFGDGGCRDKGDGGFWWSSTEKGDYPAWFRSMGNYSNMSRDGEGKFCSFSVRCVKDDNKQSAAVATDIDYSSALQTHFAKGTLGESGKTRSIEMFFQRVSKNCDFYSISGKSKTKAAEDTFSGILSISSKTADGSCNSGENEIKGSYDLKEKESKTSGRFVGSFTACEKNGKLSKASFKGNWVKHSNSSKTPCNFEL